MDNLTLIPQPQVSEHRYDLDTFQLTSKLLRQNPEYYTVWNVRRRCLISGQLSKPSAGSWPSTASQNTSANATPTPSSAASLPSSSTETQPAPASQTAGTSGTIPDHDPIASPERDLETLQAELAFTMPLLIQYPKCYWIWNYRLWVLAQAIEHLPTGKARSLWEAELGLVGKMLHRDQRNFHAWGYRRHVVAKLESSVLAGESLVEPEFEYTNKMINANLSNFSAWHNRSQLIPRLLKERNADDAARREFLDKELDQIRDAVNVGPEDQSLWFYHQYLIMNILQPAGPLTIAPGLTVEEREEYVLREIDEAKDLLEDYQDIKWIYEVLLEYTLAIPQLLGRASSAEEQANVSSWLSKLKELDPKRSGRWRDMEAEAGLQTS
ncbi:Geranylgeranyl transferase type-2 subunit alpha [Paramyrothecium foliicola]|nr:Geranylgeranyl transferase type-2 subunit alpha [Paramyrothecium foliicola]